MTSEHPGGDSGHVETGAEVVTAVEAVRGRLADLDGQPVAGHVAVYDEIHAVLQGALAGLDQV